MNRSSSRTEAVFEDLVIREDHQPAAEQKIASYMTHELRAPLTSIRSALGLLQEQLDSRMMPDEKQVMSLALKNTERLAGLINDILDFAKLQAGKMAPMSQPAAPRALIQEAVDSLSAWALARGIKLTRVAEAEPLPRVYGDVKRTVQVLTNLVSNALKFTPTAGRVEVKAELGRHEHEGTIVFSVKDTGCGIPAKDLEKIFRCFEQSANGAKSGQGTGLGLTLARAMVEMQGGRIWVESWKGLGSTFYFTIPIHQADLARPVKVYPKPAEFHGLFVGLYKRLNAVVSFFF